MSFHKLSRLVSVAAIGSLFAVAAFAHEPRPGPNGGWKVDAGAWHAELVADGTTTVVVHLFDAGDQPVSAEGWSAKAILLVDGTAQRFDLAPDADGRLSGTSAVAVPKDVKGAIQLDAPDGTTAQAKY
jgi:hypothetical protein